MSGTDRGRGVGTRLQPAGARRGGRARRARRRRRPRRSPTAPCPGLDWAAEQGIDTVLRAAAATDAIAGRDAARRWRRTSSSSPATCASSGRRCSRRFARPDPQRAPVAAAVVPGRCTPSRDALAAGRGGHRRHRAPRGRDARRRADRRPGGRPGPPRRHRGDPPRADPRRSSTGCCRRRGAGCCGARDGRPRARAGRPSIAAVADASMPVPRRALLSVSDKTGLADLGRGLVGARLRAGLDRRHGAGPARGRPAGHRRRRRHRLPRDARRPGQDAPSAGPRRASWRTAGAPTIARRSLAAGDRPVRARRRQPLPVRRGGPQAGDLVRRPGRGDRHRRPVDGPRGGEEPRVGRDRDLARRATTAVLAALDEHGAVPLGLRSAPRGRGVPPHRRLRRPDRGGAAVPDGRRRASSCRPSPACPASTIRTRRCSRSRWTRSRPSATARTRTSPPRATAGRTASRAPARARSRPASRRSRARRSATTTCSTRRLRRRSAAPLRGPGRRHRASTPTRAARPSARPCSRPGRRRSPAIPCRPSAAWSAVTRHGRPRAGRAAASRSSSRSSSRPGSTPARAEVLATKPNLRLVVDPNLDAAADRSGLPARGRPGRRAGLVPDRGRRRPGHGARTRSPTTRPTWSCTTSRRPTERELADLDLAWRLCRGVVSNAIVLVRDGHARGPRAPGRSRASTPCQGAVDKAAAVPGRGRRRGRRRRLGRVLPVPRRAARSCSRPGVTAIVQPGGSMRDAEVLVDVDEAGAAMMITGRRHFRH